MKNIVFDIGNVLTDYRLKEFLAEKGFDGLMIKRILKASILSPYWEQFERAEITEEEALKAFASMDPEIEKDLRKAYENCHGMLIIRDFAIDWIKNLKEAGYGVYYLSNYSKKAYVDCADSLEFMKYMDGGLLSFEAKMTKPDPGVFKLFLQRFNLNPEECIFIDDTEENVEAANALGFQGIVFRSYEETQAKINELVANENE